MTTERARGSPLYSPAAVAKMERTDLHRIYDISYEHNYVVCTCGWEGDAVGVRSFASHHREMEKASRG